MFLESMGVMQREEPHLPSHPHPQDTCSKNGQRNEKRKVFDHAKNGEDAILFQLLQPIFYSDIIIISYESKRVRE